MAVLCLLRQDAAACTGLLDGPVGTVVEVTDGDTVVLEDGTRVRMIGTQAPKLPLGREGFVAWPLAEEAQAALSELALNKKVQVRFGGEQVDRYERALGHVFVQGEREVWAQQWMVANGLARVYSFPDNRKCLDELMKAEQQARAATLGIWSDPYYSVRRADNPAEILSREGRYELVEGQVMLAEKAGGTIYLNFGSNWKEDVTAVIDKQAQALFTQSGLDPLALGGKRVRIRGWVDSRDGPRIAITHPEQIEVLSTP